MKISRYTLHSLAIITSMAFLVQLISSCARMGSPDGGWFDETPPTVVSASPEDRGVDVKAKKVVINFSEYIKVDNPNEKVIVSPPQLEQAEIKAAGKRIIVELKDTLKENTTYTIDFSDAISDNNEGNPLGNYTYSFSTGPQIDTLEVSGVVLNAEDLEPVKGTLVGLYDDLADSAFTTKPLLRVSRTDSSGRFIIRGVAPGTYHVFALGDTDGDFKYSQAAEPIAFTSETFTPTCMPDTRQDTIWTDTLHIRDIKRVGYTHFLPDNIVLRQFTRELTDRYFLKCERKDERHIDAYFSGKSTHTPVMKGLDFDADSAFIINKNATNDTLQFWLKDTMLINRDSLSITLTYEMSDSMGQRIMQTDTLDLVAKTPYAKRQRELQKRIEEWQKDLKKKLKSNPDMPIDTVYHEPPLKPDFKIGQSIVPDESILIRFGTPLARFDTSAVHLYVKKDEDWYISPYHIERRLSPYLENETYELYAEWRPELEYSFEIDTLAFEDIYGAKSHPYKTGFKVAATKTFSSLFVNISGNDSSTVVVQLMSSGDKVVKQAVAIDNTAEFYYLKPDTYYLRAFIDTNNNGKWDTGNYELGLQPEAVYYNREKVECKANWDMTRNWDLTAIPLERQKPASLTKQKADKKKTIRQRNAQRAKEKGIPEPQMKN